MSRHSSLGASQAMSRHSSVFCSSLCRDILRLCCDISALANFVLPFLLDLFLLHSKLAKHKFGDYSIIMH